MFALLIIGCLGVSETRWLSSLQFVQGSNRGFSQGSLQGVVSAFQLISGEQYIGMTTSSIVCMCQLSCACNSKLRNLMVLTNDVHLMCGASVNCTDINSTIVARVRSVVRQLEVGDSNVCIISVQIDAVLPGIIHSRRFRGTFTPINYRCSLVLAIIIMTPHHDC